MKRDRILPEEVLDGVKERFGTSPPSSPPTDLGNPPSPIIGETYSRSLDDAATLLLNILSPSIRSYVLELADITLHIPRWQLLLGALMSQYESGNLTAPSIDPSWREVEAIIGDSICDLETCKKTFTPKRFKQRYCSTQCGDIARGIEIKRRNKERDDLTKKEIEAAKEARMRRRSFLFGDGRLRLLRWEKDKKLHLFLILRESYLQIERLLN